MLNLAIDRLDYGEQLRAPAGYSLDQAIATTYSLDLEALIAASLALHLDLTLEGNIAGEKIALLESLDCLTKKLVVFYQRGNVKVPTNFNRLFSLLEPMLAPAFAIDGAEGAFASFHPKIWVLQFAPLDKRQPVLVRLLVLSRNLSFDRSWDLAVCLDGVALQHGGNGDLRLPAFLRSLPGQGHHAEIVENLCATLRAVEWTLPQGFKNRALDLQMLAGSARRADTKAQVPFDLDGEIEELLVVSPFVDAGAHSLLQHLGGRTAGAKTLISRIDTLDALGEEALAGWDVRSLSDRVEDGEERLQKEAPQPQGLHAKLVVAKVGNQAIWHIGSANMTNAAFGRAGSIGRSREPRNTEFMLRLVGDDKLVGPACLLSEWAASNVFEQHIFGQQVDASAERDPALRHLVHGLVSAKWMLHAEEDKDENFSIHLSIETMPVLAPGFHVNVGLLCRPSEKALAPSLTWDRLKLTDVSAFMSVEVSSANIMHRFAIQAAFTVDLFERRKRAVLKEMVDSPEKLLRYLALLLDAGAAQAGWKHAAHGEGEGDGVDVFGLDGRGGLYEQLLRAASRAPDRLARAIQVFERIGGEGAQIPEGLRELIAGFKPFKAQK